ELGQSDLGTVGSNALGDLVDADEEARLRDGHAAAEDDRLRVDDGRDVRERGAEAHERLVVELAAPASRRAASGDVRRAADVGLEVAGRAEVRLPLAIVHVDAADLTRVPAMAAVDPAVDDDAGADAGAEEDEDERAGPALAALPVLADGGEVHVVVDRYGD